MKAKVLVESGNQGNGAQPTEHVRRTLWPPPRSKGSDADRRHDAAREDVAAGAVRVARDEQELLAAPADQAVGVAHDLREAAGDLGEHAVAAVVAVLVVDLLEVVDVDDVEDQVAVAGPVLRRRRVDAQGPVDVVLDDRREEPAVARPRQGVGERRLAQLAVGRRELGAARRDGLLQPPALGLEVPRAPAHDHRETAAAASSSPERARPPRLPPGGLHLEANSGRLAGTTLPAAEMQRTSNVYVPLGSAGKARLGQLGLGVLVDEARPSDSGSGPCAAR